ncbi:MAG: hypothetical protein GXP49_09450 [Deltaproteobacteria bacterium]|nr:hypothetical protein [Deltaproteobacteria bacterium]
MPRYSYLKLSPGMIIGFRFQATMQGGAGFAPYFFYFSSNHSLKTLEPYSKLIGVEEPDGYRIEPKLRSKLLNDSIRLTAYGVGIDYLIYQGKWIQPYFGAGLGGGALKFPGREAEKMGLGSAGLAIHAMVGTDVFFYKGFALGFELRFVHLFTDNPFDRHESEGRGITLLCVSALLKYWDR